MNDTRTICHPRSKRTTALALAMVMAALPFLAHPVLAQPTVDAAASHAKIEPAPVKVRKGTRALKPFKHKVTFSSQPTDTEVITARVFLEPLMPIDSTPVSGENAALTKSLIAFKAKANANDVSDLTSFLVAFPQSRWNPALELNLALLRFDTGHWSEALARLQSAWEKSKTQTGEAKAIADRAIAELVRLEARLGRMEQLENHLAEIDGRVMPAGTQSKIHSARDGLYMMKHNPGAAFKCGPYAVNTLLFLNKPAVGCDRKIIGAHSTAKGTSLSQVNQLASDVGLNYQMARRSSGASVIVPSIIHWKVGHFAAITAENHGRYQIKDPTFGMDSNFWLLPEAIDAESDGYFLVPAGPLPDGWQQVAISEGNTVWGKGYAQGRNPSKTPSNNKKSPGGDGGDCNGMAKAYVFSMQSSLNVQDVPIGYSTPLGPDMSFLCNYNDEEEIAPGTYAWPNLGDDWNLNWVSYLTVDSSQNVTIVVRGGGFEKYNFVQPDNISNPYSPNLTSQATLTAISAGALYERNLPDGSKEVYGQADSAGRVFMTQVVDPQGNSTNITYDANFRITAITDPLSQVTTFSYLGSNPANQDYYKITTISDPFSRTATFTYDASNPKMLVKITDVIGLQSEFAYDSATGSMQLLKTPYGNTSFIKYTPVGTPAPSYPPVGLRFCFPDGTAAVIENWLDESKATYYWDRHMLSENPNDPANNIYSNCETTKWLFDGSTLTESPVINYVKPPLESQITYVTPGEVGNNYLGTSNRPIKISRSTQGNPGTNIALSGAITAGDVLNIIITYVSGGTHQTTVSHTVQATDTLSSIAVDLASGVAGSGVPGISTAASGPNVFISALDVPASFGQSASPGTTTDMVITSNQNPTAEAAVGGSMTAGGKLNLTVTDPSIQGGSKTIEYTIQAGDDDAAAAEGLEHVVNQDPTLQSLVLATAADNIVTLQSFSGNGTTYSGSGTGGPDLDILYSPHTQVWQYEYNAAGNMTKSIDPIGRTFSYLYAANNVDLLEIRQTKSGANDLIGKWLFGVTPPHRPTAYIDASGRKTQYGYNSDAQLTTITDANNDTTTLVYTSKYLTKIDGPLSTVDDTTFAYDGYGRVQTVTDSEGYVLTYSYDAADRATKVTYPDATFEQIVYDRLDAILFKDRLGRWTQNAYDSMDQLSFVLDPLGRKTQYEWCDCGSLSSLTDPKGQETGWGHDLQGRVTSKTYADSTAVGYTYTNIGQLLQVTDALGQHKTYTYFLDNALSKIAYTNTVNATSDVLLTYDSTYPRMTHLQNGWGTIDYSYNAYLTDPFGTPTTGAGRLSTIHNGTIDNSDITFSYDVLGRITNRQINASSNSVTWTFDAINRVQSEQNALGTFGYTYVDETPNDKGTLRLSEIAYPNGQKANLAWNPNIADQRLQQIDNVTSAPATISRFRYGYNTASEITQWAQNQNSTDSHLTAGYDYASQLTTAPLDSGTTTTVIVGGTGTNGDQYKITVLDPGLSGGSQTATYTASGTPTATTIAAGLVTALGGVTGIGISASSSAGTVTITSVAARATGFVPTTSAGATAYLTQAVAATKTPTVTQYTYAYDTAANRNSVTIGGSTTTAAFNNVNAMTSTSPGGNMSYDANGNLTNVSAAVYPQYKWDAENRLIRIDYDNTGNNHSDFAYDGLGRCVTITETTSGSLTSTKQFVWCGNERCEERDASDAITKQFFGLGQRNSSTNYTYNIDSLRSVREMTNSSAAIQAQYGYDPYGVKTVIGTESVPADFQYAGYYFHSRSGLNLTRTRAYSALFGRFISRDPIEETGGTNLYAYVQNNPVRSRDPLGLYLTPMIAPRLSKCDAKLKRTPFKAPINELLPRPVSPVRPTEIPFPEFTPQEQVDRYKNMPPEEFLQEKMPGNQENIESPEYQERQMQDMMKQLLPKLLH